MGKTALACALSIAWPASAAAGPPLLPDASDELSPAPAAEPLVDEPVAGPPVAAPSQDIVDAPPALEPVEGPLREVDGSDEPLVTAPRANQTPKIVLRPAPIGDPTMPRTTADPFAAVGDRAPSDGVPRWQKVGLGVSAGVATASLIGALSFGVPVLRANNHRGRLYTNLIDSAEASLTDGVGDGLAGTPNDVDPHATTPAGAPIDICAVAMHRPNPNSDAVYNADVATVCHRGQTMAKAATGFLVVFGMSMVSTVVFTGLILAHPKLKERRAARRNKLELAGGFNGRSVTLSASGRF